MVGYTSTTKDLKTALKFAFYGDYDDKIPVVFEILFTGTSGLFQLTQTFSAYPGEQEVLVQDGLTYLVTDNLEQV